MPAIISWWTWVTQLQPAFSRQSTFYLAVLALCAFCLQRDRLGGVSSMIRVLGIDPDRCYPRLVAFFHSKAIKLTKLRQLWVKLVCKGLGDYLVRYNGRPVLVIDGCNAPCEGKKMPASRTIRQTSSNNSKPEFIKGHAVQVVSVLARKFKQTIAVPLMIQIDSGYQLSPLPALRKTLLGVAATMLCEATEAAEEEAGFYVVADALYAVKHLMQSMVAAGNHIVTRVKSNAVAYREAEPAKHKGRGRKKSYGDKVVLNDLFAEEDKFSEISCKGGTARARTVILKLKGVDLRVKYVLVIKSDGRKFIFLTTDVELDAADVLELYGMRFSIEMSIKSLVHTVGAFSYRFWLSLKNKSKGSTEYLHRKSQKHRDRFLGKIKVYEVYMQLAVIALGLLQCLSLLHSEKIYRGFGWLRTIRPNLVPSEMVVSMYLEKHQHEFLRGKGLGAAWQKFMAEKMAKDTTLGFDKAA